MSAVAVLTTTIDEYESRLATVICEEHLRDLPGIAAVADIELVRREGSHRLRYCRTHKAYHLYTGELYQRWGNRVASEISAAIRRAYPELSKADRQGLQRHWQVVQQRAARATDKDRLRFSDWKSMWHNAQQVPRAHKPVVTPRVKVKTAGKPAKVAVPAAPTPAPAVASVRTGWEAWVGATVSLLTDTQRAEFYRCARKRAYAFEWQASAAVVELGEIPGWKRMSVYSCEFCSGWHMGHGGEGYDGFRQVDLRKAQFALTRYMKPAREFLSAQGFHVDV